MRYLTTIFSGSSCAEYQTKTFFIGKNTAISGYDPVSYFSNKPLKGKANLTYNYEGINYRFANPNNLETLKKHLKNMSLLTEAGALMPWVPKAKK
jgi:YHS domain-containing protein